MESGLRGDWFQERRVKSIHRRVDRKKLDWDFNATKKVHFEVLIKINNNLLQSKCYGPLLQSGVVDTSGSRLLSPPSDV